MIESRPNAPCGAEIEVQRGYWQPTRTVLLLTKTFFFYWYRSWEAFETKRRDERSKAPWPTAKIPGLNGYAKFWLSWSSFSLVRNLNLRLCPSRCANPATRVTAVNTVSSL
jgi:hypothetical protein